MHISVHLEASAAAFVGGPQNHDSSVDNADMRQQRMNIGSNKKNNKYDNVTSWQHAVLSRCLYYYDDNLYEE